MDFGGVISNIVAVAKLAKTVLKNARTAGKQHERFSSGVESTTIALTLLKLCAQQPGSPLCDLDEDGKKGLTDIIARCTKVLGSMNRILEHYNGMAKKKRPAKLWKEIQFGNEEVLRLSELRKELAEHTTSIHLYVALVSNQVLGKHAASMEVNISTTNRLVGSVIQSVADLRTSVDIITPSIICKHSDGSVLSTHKNDNKSFWKNLRSQLISMGFSSTTLEKYEQAIMEYVQALGDAGALDSQIDDEEDETNSRNGSHALQVRPPGSGSSNLSGTTIRVQSCSLQRTTQWIGGSLPEAPPSLDVGGRQGQGVAQGQAKGKTPAATEDQGMRVASKLMIVTESTQERLFEPLGPSQGIHGEASRAQDEETPANENPQIEAPGVQSTGATVQIVPPPIPRQPRLTGHGMILHEPEPWQASDVHWGYSGPQSELVLCHTCQFSKCQREECKRLQCDHWICSWCLNCKFRLSICLPEFKLPTCCDKENGLDKLVRDLPHEVQIMYGNRVLEHHKNLVYCANPECGRWITDFVENPLGRYTCKKCKSKVCGTCKLEYHQGEPCKGDAEVREMLAKAEERRWQKRHALGVEWGFFEAE